MAIKVPRGVTRPTTDLVRQAVFSILGEQVVGARVLDLFAGSGAMGLEALSRGGSSCLFIEQDRAAERVIRENLEKTKLIGGSVFQTDVHRWLERNPGSFDLIFADPPYLKSNDVRNHLSELMGSAQFASRLSAKGLLVVEHASTEETRCAEGLEQLDRRVYGKSAILLYARTGAF